MTTINTAEIEARLADMITNGVTVTATGDLEISDDLLATLAATEAAFKAETARADGLAHEKPQWIHHLSDANDHIAELNGTVRRQEHLLGAANEKLATAREAVGNLRDALGGFARIEVPIDAPNSQWVAKTLHCNDQVTAGQVLRARAVLFDTADTGDGNGR